MIQEIVITDSLKGKYMPYSAHVILHRALPEIDGFKPSQRRILYTMFKMGLLKGQKQKSAKVVGQGLALNPHGDQSLYDTAVRLSKDHEAMLLPYIDSKGNFGKYYSRDTQYAAMRYTNMKLEKVSEELFKGIDKNSVDMIDNFDNTMKEPRLLPVSFPSILTNPISGTAVGMASDFCPFNLGELTDYTSAILTHGKEVDIFDYIIAPDFPSGGNIIFDKNSFKKIYETGRGSFKIRAEYEFHEDYIHIKTIPHTTKVEIIIDRIVELVKNGKIKSITDVNDIYGNNTKGIRISVKHNADKELIMQQLFKMTTLEDAFSCNFNLIINGRPKVLGVKDILLEWIKFRANCIKRSSTYDLEKKQAQLHLLKGLEKVLLNIDEAVSIIRNTRKNSEVITNLSASFDIDETQAEYVADIKLRNLNEEYILDKTNNIKTLETEIEDLSDIISNKRRIADIMIEDLQRVKKLYGQPRKTAILDASEIKSGNTSVIETEDYNVKVVVTKDFYVKKIPLVSLRGSSQHKLKEGDSIISEFDVTNRGELIVITSANNAHKIRLHELNDTKLSNLGDYIPTYLNLPKDEKILYICATSDFKESMIVGYSDGKVAKVSMSGYATKQNRKVLANAYSDKSTPIFFKLITEDIDLLAVSSLNKAILLNTSSFASKSSKGASGQYMQRQKDDSKTVGFYTLDQCELEDKSYYENKSAGIGKYLKTLDKVNI